MSLESYLLQITDSNNFEECKKLITETHHKVDYDKLFAKRNLQCKNRSSVLGYNINQYSFEQLILYKDGSDVYCFTNEDLDQLRDEQINPYTGKLLAKDFIYSLDKIVLTPTRPVYPLSMAIKLLSNNEICPSSLILTDNSVKYLIWHSPLLLSTLTESFDYLESDSIKYPGGVYDYYDTKQGGFKMFVYKITLNKFTFHVGKADIKSMVEVYNGELYHSSFKGTKRRVAPELLNKLVNSLKLVDNSEITTMLALSIKDLTPIKVYIGLNWDKAAPYISVYSIGDSFKLYSGGQIMSWVSNICIAEGQINDHYGILLCATLQPKDVLINLGMVQNNNSDQILSRPYNDNKEELVFDVEVIKMVYNTHDDKRYYPSNTKSLLAHNVKDLDMLNYKIGKPISTKEAKENFIMRNIDVTKVPSGQKSSITKDGFLDLIELETIPYSKCIQLKECGTILSIDSFNELVNRGRSNWQGKENIGFKSPLTGTIYGNLVEYNYDENEFYKQKTGILNIKMIQTKPYNPKKSQTLTSIIELSYTDKMGLPYRFLSNGRSVISYLPNNKEGKSILFLTIDCFKKGNLYAFNSFGYVRHGRVHKKTDISGPFGFPDETWDLRTSGELRDMGCTPYTTFFNQERGSNNKLFKDPYPDEERWIVKFL